MAPVNDNLHPQVQTILDALQRVGTPHEAVGVLEQFARRHAEIRREQFRPEREGAELARVREHTIAELKGHLARAEQAAAAERDKALAAVDQELAASRRLPVKDLLDSDSAYTAKLVRRQIEEQRDHAVLVAASSDVMLALALDDVNELEALVGEALAGAHPEHIRRVARAAGARLQQLALAEMRRDPSPGAPRPAGEAAARVVDRTRAWYAQEASKSPAARKRQIENQHQIRMQALRDAVVAGAEQFGLRADLEAGLPGTARHTGPRDQR